MLFPCRSEISKAAYRARLIKPSVGPKAQASRLEEITSFTVTSLNRVSCCPGFDGQQIRTRRPEDYGHGSRATALGLHPNLACSLCQISFLSLCLYTHRLHTYATVHKRNHKGSQ